MTRLSQLQFTGLCIAASAFGALAADVIDEEPETSGWFIRLGGRYTSGAKVSLHDSRGTAGLPSGQYDNGFVLADVSGNAANTWNWGYNNASQVSGGALTLNRTDFGSPAPRVGAQSSVGRDSNFGGEITGGFEFVRFDFRKRDARLGFEIGYSYRSISASASATASGNLLYTTDQYALNGIVPPTAPYAGTFNGPGPILGLAPASHTVISSSATETVTSALSADLHNFRFGPWISLPFSSRFSIGASAGYAVILTDPVWRISDTYTVANPLVPTPAPITGSYSHTHFLPGGYLQLRAEYRITSRLGAYVGGDVQYNTGLSVTAPGREARFNFGTQLGGVAGLSWEF
jgi:hypothetical protein